MTPVTERVARFVDHLRLNDFPVGPAETIDALQCLSGRLESEPQAKRALKIMLASRQDEWDRFDDLFEAYWHQSGKIQHRSSGTATLANRSKPKLPSAWQQHLDQSQGRSGARNPQTDASNEEGDSPGEGNVSRIVASKNSKRGSIDLRHFVDADDIAEAEKAAYQLASALRHRLSRRYRMAKRGSKLDLRRTIRANLGHGGELLELKSKQIPDRPVRVVVFLDVSGSMKLYSRFFLHFVRGLVCRWLDADAYLINTKLMRVTDLVREKDSTKAMTRLALMAEGFGGGTKLGESLDLFNQSYAKQSLNSRSVVMILSDGYDTGSPENLARSLAQVRKRARRLVWLNPLLGWNDYQPITAGMAAALPFIDHFAVANTLDSLMAIEPDLAAL